MTHFYESLPGWFDFADLYAAVVENANDCAHLVEVGSYLGKSAAFMAVEIANSGKRITFDACDLFVGINRENYSHEEGFRVQEAVIAEHGSLEQACRANLAPVADRVNVRVGDSLALAATYADESLDFVFLDDDHSEAHLYAEMAAWWPKVKRGGVMAGHDWEWQSVRDGAKKWATKTGVPLEPVSTRCWMVDKPLLAPNWIVPAGERKCLVAVCCNERTIARHTADSLIRIGWGQRVTDAAKAHGFTSVDFAWTSRYVTVADLRDDAVLIALKGEYSHILFLDADMTWPDDVLTRMLAHHSRGIVSGLYFLKSWPHSPVALKGGTWNPVDQAIDYVYDTAAPHSGALRRERLVGMGCTIVPVEVFRHYPRPWFQYQVNGSGMSTITEDVWFCQQAEKVGCPIWLDASIECRHIGMESVGAEHFDRAMCEMVMLNNEQRLRVAQETP